MIRPAFDHRPARADHVPGPGLTDARGMLVWRFPEPVAALSSAPVGGGRAAIDWLVNVGVVDGYRRTDLDAHVAELADRIGLRGTGAGLLTAADVAANRHAEDDGVAVDATVGVTKPTWAADDEGAYSVRDGGGWRGGLRSTGAPDADRRPGTINVIVQVPVAVSPAAAVNAIVTATEAKCQALAEAGVPGTGTASDAVVVCWPPTLPAVDFAGPRSPWGARIARAVHAAVRDGLDDDGGPT